MTGVNNTTKEDAISDHFIKELPLHALLVLIWTKSCPRNEKA
ncbi:MAG: hypothetical protein ACQEXX_06365 [Bacillota bacterium]